MIPSEFVIVTCFGVFVTAFAQPPGGYYQTKYDALDVEDVLNHKRLVHHYAACLLNRGPYPPQGADLKRILPEALETNCLRCTEKQKEVVLRTIRRLREEYSSLWKEVIDLYDPTGQYIRRFEESLSGKVPVEDQDNFLDNRFGDEDEANNVVAPDSSTPGRFPYSSTSTTRRTTTTTTTTTTTKKPIVSTTKKFPLLSIWNFHTLQDVDRPTTTHLNRWRPQTQNAPQYTFRPAANINEGMNNFFGSITNLSNKFIQAGSQVAGMVLQTVQALVGNN